jgi:tRNA (adenine57-N1/adenine58-N1)-methyltransferase
MLSPGKLIILVSPKGKRYMRLLDPAEEMHTSDGVVSMAKVAEAGFGGSVETHMGKPYRILKPTLYDLVKGVKRQTQIIYPKEIGYILLKLGVGPGVRVVEAGGGSGSLTMALAWSVGEEGRVYSFERREEFSRLAAKNVARAGLDHRVEFATRDISEGFEVRDADCLFLDVRTPWDYLDQAAAAVIGGAPVGFLLPTTNQVQELLAALESAPFGDVEVLEIMLRKYKPVADRLRPDDRMVAHTGFLVFARQQETREERPTGESADIERTEAEETPESGSVGLTDT